jgi:hypothetical protein
MYLAMRSLTDSVTGPTSLADRDAELKEAMDNEMLRLFRLLSTRRASLVINKFKNLAAGGPEVMLAIPNLSNSPSFDWTSCDVPACASMTNYEKEREKVEAVFVGPDAKNTPWTFDCGSNFPSDPEAGRPQRPALPRLRQVAPASASALLPASVPPPALSTGRSNIRSSSEDVGTSKAVKRKRDNGSSNESRASSSLSTLGMLLMTPQVNPPEASSIPDVLPPTYEDPGPRKSSWLAFKKQKQDLINVCSSVCHVV